MSDLKYTLLIPVIALFLFIPSVQAEMESEHYKITSTVISGGGAMMESTSYKLVGTLGQAPIGKSISGSYGLASGFWYTILLYSVGDVNGDGSVNLKDVIAALQVVTGQSPAAIIKAADADGDDKIGLAEALHILRTLGY